MAHWNSVLIMLFTPVRSLVEISTLITLLWRVIIQCREWITKLNSKYELGVLNRHKLVSVLFIMKNRHKYPSNSNQTTSSVGSWEVGLTGSAEFK